jgi:hypothetical protein
LGIALQISHLVFDDVPFDLHGFFGELFQFFVHGEQVKDILAFSIGGMVDFLWN